LDNPRHGAPARKAVGLSLGLAVLAGLVAACAGSTPSGQSYQPTLGSTPATQEPTVSLETSAGPDTSVAPEPTPNPTPTATPKSSASPKPTAKPAGGSQSPWPTEDCSYGGYGSAGSFLSDLGYVKRSDDLLTKAQLNQIRSIIEKSLPKAVDLNKVEVGEPYPRGDVFVDWSPTGYCVSLLPPGGHGERIYMAAVNLGPYLRGGDAVAYVWFVNAADGGAVPNRYFDYRIDKGTAAALLDLFWVKSSPAAS
jgi:hypothetical protein